MLGVMKKAIRLFFIFLRILLVDSVFCRNFAIRLSRSFSAGRVSARSARSDLQSDRIEYKHLQCDTK